MLPIADVLKSIADAFDRPDVVSGKIDVTVALRGNPDVNVEMYQHLYELGCELIVPLIRGGFTVYFFSEEKWVYLTQKGWTVDD